MKHSESENALINQERKSKELEIQNESLDQEIADLLRFCKVTEEQLTTYVSTPSYFTDAQWETLNLERKRLDDALDAKLACIPNPKKAKKAQQERHVAPHWLFVR
jgi:hypothetical protein